MHLQCFITLPLNLFLFSHKGHTSKLCFLFILQFFTLLSVCVCFSCASSNDDFKMNLFSQGPHLKYKFAASSHFFRLLNDVLLFFNVLHTITLDIESVFTMVTVEGVYSMSPHLHSLLFSQWSHLKEVFATATDKALQKIIPLITLLSFVTWDLWCWCNLTLPSTLDLSLCPSHPCHHCTGVLIHRLLPPEFSINLKTKPIYLVHIN